jgi:hypothetical protein
MLGALKKFFASQGLGPGWPDVADWAAGQGYGFKRAREEEGFIVDATAAGKPWRMEWGPSQRDYIDGRELRLRMDLGLPGDLQMLVMSRPLVESLERRTFEQSTQGNQTQIDTSTPEEMRWLIMFQKVNLGGSKLLRAHVGAVASSPESGAAWIEGPLGAHLERALGSFLAGDPPFVLMTHRGKAYLRLRAPDIDARLAADAAALFETAAAQALRVAGGRKDSPGWPQSSTNWQHLGGDAPPRR